MKPGYTAVMIADPENHPETFGGWQNERRKLLDALQGEYPGDWKEIAHHMTIFFGAELPPGVTPGEKVTLQATKVGFLEDRVMAVAVEGYPTGNATPHITVAVNTNVGAKPFESNKITEWTDLPKPITLEGMVGQIAVQGRDPVTDHVMIR